MPTERRGSERHARRVEVRFWRQGGDLTHTGFTTNISTTGLFLGTTQSLEPGERVRLEILDRNGGFVVEGQVARVHRVSISLRHVEQPGAGIRFLTPPELVAKLLPAARQTGGVGRAQAGGASRFGRGAGVPARGGEGEGATAAGAPPAATESSAASSPAHGASAGERQPPGTPRPESGEPPLVVVEFPDRTGFLSVYHRDLAAGSMHISTDVPAQLHETIRVELRPPLAGVEPLRFEAVVVHRFAPRAAVGPGGNVLAGMGVRFKDPVAVKAALAPVLEELRRGPSTP